MHFIPGQRNTNLLKSYIFLLVFTCFSCTANKYAVTNKRYKKQARTFAKTIRQYPLKDSFATSSQWVGTTNFGMRKPNFVIIHHTAQNSCDQTLQTFTLPRTQVSAHYVICKDGTVYHMLNDFLRAWHAGNSRWGNVTDVNSSSIGIEIDNNGFEVFTEQQINSLMNLLALLKKSHSIPTANFIGHSDIAPTRKVDPNVTFPWKFLADKGFGLWYGDTSKVTVPQNFDHLSALRIIGYDIRDTAAAIGAFKRHFEMQESKTLNEADKKILYDLSVRYR
jgi:N-acetylmuramoyl-L-alanine amidase